MSKPTPKPREGKGAEFVKWFRPLIECLHELGTAKPREAADWIAEKESVPPAILELVNKNGGQRFLNQVCFARQYLLWEGLIDGSRRGIWSLTPKGLKTRISDSQARAIFLKWVKYWADARQGSPQKEQNSSDEPVEEAVALVEEEEERENSLLGALRNLSPKGFEHFCRFLLIAHGFENVKVTGQTGDGGIDGEGVLQINPFVSSVVVFQCKRYKRSVSREEVSRLRGDTGGRADKALLITTGSFTAPARTEASRTTPRIELIDGQQLVTMCEEKEIGLKPRTVYDLNPEFFIQFGV